MTSGSLEAVIPAYHTTLRHIKEDRVVNLELNLSTPVIRDSPFGRNICSAEQPAGVQRTYASQIKRASCVAVMNFLFNFYE